MEKTLRDFASKFDQNDLNGVMGFFTPDAIYRTIEGDSITGVENIRKAFEPQFMGAYGKMTFEITDVVVDTAKRKATLIWICHHDFSPKAVGFKNEMTRNLYKLFSGSPAFWYGLDVFELNSEGLIRSKSSYTTSKFPRMFNK